MVLEQPTEGFHLVAITLLSCLGKHFWEDTLSKLLRIIVLGLLGQFTTYLGLIQLVIYALNQHSIFLGKIAPKHHVHLVNDIRKQVALVVWAITSSRLRC